MAKKAKKTKVQKTGTNKFKLSKENDTLLQSLVGMKPSSLSGSKLGDYLIAIGRELDLLDDQDKIKEA